MLGTDRFMCVVCISTPSIYPAAAGARGGAGVTALGDPAFKKREAIKCAAGLAPLVYTNATWHTRERSKESEEPRGAETNDARRAARSLLSVATRGAGPGAVGRGHRGCGVLLRRTWRVSFATL